MVAVHIDWNLPRDDYRTQDEFDSAFLADLKSARLSVLIKAPYAKVNRIKQLDSALLDLPRRGVQVCVFVQEPRLWEQRERANAVDIATIRELEIARDLLEEHGIHVNLVKGIHQKLCVIDCCTLWVGSLNILSHYDTKEEMMRKVDPSASLAAIQRNLMDRCMPCSEARKPVPPVERMAEIKNIGRRLAELREQSGYTVQTLSELTGISRSQISRIEKNEREPSHKQVITLLMALGRDPCIVTPGAVRFLRTADVIVGEALTRSQSR